MATAKKSTAKTTKAEAPEPNVEQAVADPATTATPDAEHAVQEIAPAAAPGAELPNAEEPQPAAGAPETTPDEESSTEDEDGKQDGAEEPKTEQSRASLLSRFTRGGEEAPAPVAPAAPKAPKVTGRTVRLGDDDSSAIVAVTMYRTEANGMMIQAYKGDRVAGDETKIARGIERGSLLEDA